MILKESPLTNNFCRNLSLLAPVILFCIISSCVTQRDIEYLQDENKDIKAFDEAEFPDYKLKPNDELYIQVHSLDEAAASVFSDSRGQVMYTGSIQPYGASLLSYSIDKEGYVFLPVIGKILVIDKTVSEVGTIFKGFSESHFKSANCVSEISKPLYFNYGGSAKSGTFSLCSG